jgi:hypothetical protein
VIPDTLAALVRKLPPPGKVWPLAERVIFFQALDAVLALEYGGNTSMIWIGKDGEIHIAERECVAKLKQGDK